MMLLSSYMYSLSWTGYLQKLGKEYIYLLDRLHCLGLNAIFILSLIFANSIKGVIVRATAVHTFIMNPTSCKPQVLRENPKEWIINLSPFDGQLENNELIPNNIDLQDNAHFLYFLRMIGKYFYLKKLIYFLIYYLTI